MVIREIIRRAERSSMPFAAYVEKLPKNAFLNTKDIINEIKNAIIAKDGGLIECLIILAWQDGLNQEYTQVLCELLAEDWHESAEDIAMMLEEIRDPLSVESLYERALKIPEYDDGRSLAKKCIWALKAINTEQAMEKLILLTHSADHIISEAAANQLS